MKDKKIPTFRNMDAIDANIYGRHNVVINVNPYNCYFIAHYFDGKIVKGKNLFDTGWSELRDGIQKLQYQLSTGHLINIPKFKAYLSMIEVSESMEGARIFHAINVKCLGDNEVINYKIILKQDKISKYNIGDIVISKDKKIMESPHWKFSA